MFNLNLRPHFDHPPGCKTLSLEPPPRTPDEVPEGSPRPVQTLHSFLSPSLSAQGPLCPLTVVPSYSSLRPARPTPVGVPVFTSLLLKYDERHTSNPRKPRLIVTQVSSSPRFPGSSVCPSLNEGGEGLWVGGRGLRLHGRSNPHESIGRSGS